MITYTTRPMRKGEDQDKTYHFISKEKFFEMINDNMFLEYKVYHTSDGDWYYGSAKEDYENTNDKTVVILTPSGYHDFLTELPNVDHCSIYIYANRKTIKNRREDEIR